MRPRRVNERILNTSEQACGLQPGAPRGCGWRGLQIKKAKRETLSEFERGADGRSKVMAIHLITKALRTARAINNPKAAKSFFPLKNYGGETRQPGVKPVLCALPRVYSIVSIVSILELANKGCAGDSQG